MKRTPWFDAMKDKPARVGRYEFWVVGGRIFRTWWDGGVWLDEGWPVAALPGDKWRGLAEKP
jgi:hypothetical protein